MSASSRFAQIHSQILLEYIYTDQSSPETFETDDYQIEILTNQYTNTRYLFSADNVVDEMYNVRDKSAVPINSDRTKYAYLDKDIPVSYNDFDSNLTNTGSMLQSFSPDLNIEYDTVKFHLQAGFNYDDYDGMIFEIRVLQSNGSYVNLSSYVLLKTDSPILNPSPFMVGDKLYPNYIELKIPAFYYMYQSWVGDSSDQNRLGWRATDGNGFDVTGKIEIELRGIVETTVENSFSYYTTRQLNNISLNRKDEFDQLVARIEESIAGDYFELYGEYNGEIYADFMANLNQQPDSNYVVFHEIVVKEQLNNSFIETARQSFTQTGDFEDPMLFRPIVLNSNVAVSFSIEYLMRILNRVDNTQIIKISQLISTDVRKYGRRMTRLNLGTVPTVVKVYNTLPDDSGQNIVFTDNFILNSSNTSSNVPDNPITIKKEYVKVMQDRMNIQVSVNPINVQNLEE